MQKSLKIGTLLFVSTAIYATTPLKTILKQRTDALARYNQGFPTSAKSWPSKKIQINGFINVDTHPKTMQKTLAGEENHYFALSNVGLNFNSDLNTLFHAHVGIAYFKTNKGQGDRDKNTGLLLDDGYLTFSNFEKMPWFVQIGRFYLPFGKYNRYAIVPTLTQVLSFAREDGIQAGFMRWHHFNGAVYVTQGTLRRNNKRIQGNLNGGAALSYQQKLQNSLHFGSAVQYIYNMLNTNAISESDPFQTTDNSNTPLFPTANDVFQDRTDGLAAQAHIGYWKITLFGRYVSALEKSNDILLKYSSPTTRSGNAVLGARPSAWDIGGKINFKIYHLPSEFDFTYSQSNDTAGLFIFNSTRNHPVPHARYIWGYTVKWKYLMARFQWAHDWLHKVNHGDTGRQGDDISLRVGAKF